MPHTPGSPSRLHLQNLRRFHGLHPDFGGSALPVPAPKDGPLTTPQASRDATDRCFAPPSKGFRHWASTPGVSPRRRQSATGPPGSYPDRTLTGRRQRAYDQRSLTTSRPPVCWARKSARLIKPAGPGTAWPTSNSAPRNGSTGSTTSSSIPPSETSRSTNTRPTTTLTTSTNRRLESTHRASTDPGAFQRRRRMNFVN